MRLQIDEDVIEVEFKEDFVIQLNGGLLAIVPNELVNVTKKIEVIRLSEEGKTTRVILRFTPTNLNIEFMKNRIRISFMLSIYIICPQNLDDFQDSQNLNNSQDFQNSDDYLDSLNQDDDDSYSNFDYK